MITLKHLGFPVGDFVLFFGCRHQKQDYIYQKELEQFVANKTLSALYLAFSRDQERKIYVQHLMLENKVCVSFICLVYTHHTNRNACMISSQTKMRSFMCVVMQRQCKNRSSLPGMKLFVMLAKKVTRKLNISLLS